MSTIIDDMHIYIEYIHVLYTYTYKLVAHIQFLFTASCKRPSPLPASRLLGAPVLKSFCQWVKHSWRQLAVMTIVI